MYWSTLLLTSTWHNTVTFNFLKYDINPLICWYLTKLVGLVIAEGWRLSRMRKGRIIQVLPDTLNGLTHADPFEASVWRWTTNTSIQALCDPWRVQMKIVQMLKIVQVFYLFWHPASKYKINQNQTIDGRKLQLSLMILDRVVEPRGLYWPWCPLPW